MQAVILAAGKSTRTYPLTLTRPKPLLKVANKTIIEHNLDSLGFVDEAIIVVGYKKDMIKKHLGNQYKGIRITYVEQKQQLGTAHALLTAEKHVRGKFLLLAGDDIYSNQDLARCAKNRYSVLTSRVKDPENFGVILERSGIFVDIIEKPKKFVSDLISTACFSLGKDIFQYLNQIKKSGRNEYELPDALRLLSKKHKIRIIRATKWLPIAYPWDLLKADKELRKNRNIIGKNTKVLGKAKRSSIGDNCMIMGSVKNSIIMDNVFIEEGSVVENSVIGDNVTFRGQINAKNHVNLKVKGKSIKVERLGAIISDNVDAEDAHIRAGVRIWPGKKIKGKVKNDVA